MNTVENTIPVQISQTKELRLDCITDPADDVTYLIVWNGDRTFKIPAKELFEFLESRRHIWKKPSE
jgi:hypothetical protein